MNWVIIFAIIFIMLVETSATQCPNSWIASDVVPKKCYLVVSEKQTWFNADAYCKDMYPPWSYLTSIGSAFENSNILTHVIDKTSSFLCDQLWIGAIDIEGNGNFTWTDGFPFQYLNWGIGQPDSTNYCVSQSRSTGKWNTQQCSTDNCFICEYYLTSENSTSSTMEMTTQPITTSPTVHTMTDCYDWRTIGGALTDGIYRINPPGIEPFDVWCDMTTDGGGWTVFQKRMDNSTKFWNRLWSEYKHGFNNGLDRNFWLGLDRLHILSTKDTHNILRIDIFGNRCDPSVMWANYKCDPFLGPHAYYFGEWPAFSVENGNNKYRLHVSQYLAGNLSNYAYDDFWKENNNKLFSTIDNGDYDYCAGEPDTFYGGFWFGAGCGSYALNGEYNSPVFNNGFFVIRALDHEYNGAGWINPIRSEMKLKKII